MIFTRFFKLRHTGHVIILASFAFMFLKGNSQAIFNKTYKEDRPSMLFSSIIKEDSAYKMIGVVSDYSQWLWGYGRMIVSELSNQGNISMYKAFFDGVHKEYGAFDNCLIRTSNGGYAFAGYTYDSLPRTLIAFFDSDIDSVHIYEYQTPYSYAFKGETLLEYDTNVFYISGVRTDSSSLRSNVMLMRVDGVGNKQWEKYYGGFSVAESTTSFVKLNNGNLMIGSYRRDFGDLHERSYTWLLEVDTNGTMVRQWLDPNDSTYGAYGLHQTKDGGFIYSAQRKIVQYPGVVVLYEVSIVKMDSAFNKQWTYRGGGVLSTLVFSI